MSGKAPSLRSLWFGDGLTSATTQESGRNSDTSTAIRETPSARVCQRADVTNANGRASRRDAADCAETTAPDKSKWTRARRRRLDFISVLRPGRTSPPNEAVGGTNARYAPFMGPINKIG